MEDCGLASCGVGERIVAGFKQEGNELPVFTNCRQYSRKESAGRVNYSARKLLMKVHKFKT